MSIAKTAQIYPGTILERPTEIGEFVIIGHPARTDCEAARIGPRALIRSHTVIYTGTQIGDDFQTGHNVLVREQNIIGNEVSIGSHTVLEHHVQIGNRVRIHSNAFIPEYTVLDDESWLGPNVCLTNAPHPLCPNFPKCLKPVVLHKGAKVGAGATILPGVSIGELSLIGAGAVVTKDVPPGTVVAGNPAVVIREVSDLVCDWDQLTRPYAR
jgi:acetyltransferase-like isoleucine patch superfamily enzyme